MARVNRKEMLKNSLIRLLGYERFLYVVSRVRISTFRQRKAYEDFRFFASLIPDNSAVLDIGANIGVTTYYLARHRPRNTIFSFEPIPQNFLTLKKLVRNQHLDNVKLYNIGVGKEESELAMILPVINGIKRHTLAQIWDENSQYTAGEKYAVPVKPIDGIRELADQHVKAIKIDVEGYEYFVVQGALELIRRNRPIIFCELTNTPNSLKTIRLLESMSYQLKQFHNGRLVNPGVHDKRGVDFFFLPCK